MSLWLLVATENCADSWDPSLILDPGLAENQLDPYGRIKEVDSVC
jgi:hypothetical protein